MDAPRFPMLSKARLGTWSFSLARGLTFLFLAAITFYSTARMPKHPYFKVQTIGLGGIARPWA